MATSLEQVGGDTWVQVPATWGAYVRLLKARGDRINPKYTFIEGVRTLDKLVMGVDPPPDLAIEVVVSNPVRDSLSVHAAFGVREVWVCRDQDLKFLVLGADRLYAASERSVCLPFLTPEDLFPWVYREDLPTENAIRRQFRTWVETTLAPRHRPGDHEGPDPARPGGA